jgi:predicted nuclease of predicted toxin-antitoxin system
LSEGSGRTIRFHLDEMCDPRIAVALRKRGIEITTASDALLLGQTDEAHLNSARLENRVIVTHDSDFLRLHAQGHLHAGIVYSSPQSCTLGDLIRLLAILWELVSADEMCNRVEFL